MYRQIRRAAALAPVAAFALTIACGGRSPVAPSETSTIALPAPVTMSASAASGVRTAAAPPQAASVSGAHLNGVIESIDADARTLGVRDKTVSVPEAATIETNDGTPVAFADLSVGTRVHVTGTEDGSSVVASIVRVHAAHGGGHSNHAQAEGAASDLAGDCPDRTFKIGSTAVTVNTATEFSRGVCSDIADGRVVEVRGTVQEGGALLATLVQFARVEHAPHHADAIGAVSDLAGACPDRSFKIGSTVVTVSVLTEFARGDCGDLANERNVEVRGTPVEGGIAATVVKFENPHNPSPGPSTPNPSPAPGKPARDVKFEGTVSAFGGACPAVTFTAGGRSVATNGSTKYAAGRCGDVANGRKVEVTGSEVDDVVTAWQVRFVKK